jgi:uncharacterized protein
MGTHEKHAPLGVRELGQLAGFLSQATNPSALSLEGMDGLFCALIAGPACVVPTEYLPLLFGGPLHDEIVRFKVAHVNAMICLLTRHWNSILSELEGGAGHPPLIVRGVAGAIPGRAWAQGFMRGVNFVRVGWNELLQDETSSQANRISRLGQEPDSCIRQDIDPQAISEEILPWLARAVSDTYRHFLDRRLEDRLMVELTADVATRWLNSTDPPP